LWTAEELNFKDSSMESDQAINIQRSTVHIRRSAFTLVEVLTVVLIITILLTLLIPVVSKVKTAAQEANTKALIQSLDGAIQNYYNTYRAYPGPIPNHLIAKTDAIATNFGFNTFEFGSTTDNPGFDVTQPDTLLHTKITGAENLVLGLCGGLRVDTTNPQTALKYEPSQVTQGPASLNAANPKRSGSFLAETKDLSFRVTSAGKTGHFEDESGEANDSPIPEFLDRFTAGPMPVLYMRSRPGAKKTTASNVAPTLADNGVINEYNTIGNRYAAAQQYDLAQIIAYTGAYSGAYPGLTLAASGSAGRSIGQGKSVRRADYTVANDYLRHGLNDAAFPFKSMDKSAATYLFPYDAYPYFADPNTPNTARQKDGYILISAGRDRVYGTNDDITNFGPVK
jgi:type II secretory pathway pseudopilin PulG